MTKTAVKAQTIAKASIAHNSVSVKVKFPTEETIRFGINRSSETFGLRKEIPLSQPEMRLIYDCFRNMGGEKISYGARVEMIADYVRPCESIDELISKIKTGENK